MSISTISNSANLHLYYEKKLLETLEPRLVLYQLGKKQNLPKGMGKQVKWLRYAAIPESTSTLAEGTPPLELSVSTSNVTADIAQYGQFSKVTDLLSDTAIDPVVENLAERFGRAAAKTVEKLIVNELDSQAAVQRVNNRTADANIVAGDVLNHKELIEAMIRMKADYIEEHESGSFVSVLHPLAEYDLNVIGSEAFGVVELNKQAIKMIRKSLGSAGGADPLDQYSTVGYKIHGFATKYLDSSSKRVIRIKSSSALGTN